jgi:hypothetical protein
VAVFNLMAYNLCFFNRLKQEVMKTMKIKTAGLFLAIGFFGLSSDCFSQDIKLTRQELKEARKAQLVANYYILDSLLNAKTFVLEADYLQNRYGDRIPVLSDLNFIKINETKGVLQTGSSFNTGYNGVGGVTAEGSIGSWNIYKNEKRLSYTVHFSLLTNIGHYDVMMNVSSNTRASATITGLGPGRLTWEGHLVTLYNSRIFKGINTI